MDREELLEREHASWSALEAAVGRVPSDRRAVDGVVPGWSVKDLLWHCAYWAGFWAGTTEARAAARPERARAALAKAIDDAYVKWLVEETFEHYDEHVVEIARFADFPP